MPEIDKVLGKLGLEEQEIKAYTALLDLGEVTAAKIAERTGLGRVHMYQLTNRLIKKGLVSYIIKNNVKYFNAASPITLLKNLESTYEELKSVIPLLEARQNSAHQDAKVEIYRGREGVNTILKTIIKDAKPYYFMGGVEESCSVFELESKIFVKRAEKLKIPGKILSRKEESFFVGKNEEYRFLPKNVIMPTTNWIWGNKTGIFIWEEPYYVVLIESKQITKSNLATFKYLFGIAEKPSLNDKKERLLK